MRLYAVVVALVLVKSLTVWGLRIIQSNDDGWAELYTRCLKDELHAVGHEVLLSAPAYDQSGKGSLDEDPLPLSRPCQYNSCPGERGPFGHNKTRPDLCWVNSYPVTAMRYGLERFAPRLWNSNSPELAVTGPNVGSNLGNLRFSGTVASAVYAEQEKRIPAIAFSAASGGKRLPWDTSPKPVRCKLYAVLATQLVGKLTQGNKPYLPRDTWLNVNFPTVSDAHCTDPDDFKWVLSRVSSKFASRPDVKICGSERLPDERRVIDTQGCYISISVANSKDKATASREKQKEVVKKLNNFLSCLPVT
ncbi:5'/3'-nucleotidase sure [Colletotrichum somersetense]|nr:5'/3'-nucleotidase sure [Colletotrichum somersetense]